MKQDKFKRAKNIELSPIEIINKGIKFLELVEGEFKNIYKNNFVNLPLKDYSKRELQKIKAKIQTGEDLTKFSSDLKKIEKIINSKETYESQILSATQKDLLENIYGTNYQKLPYYSKVDLYNAKLLLNNLTEEQRKEFLNSSSYYGARRYSRPVAESKTFADQVRNEGKSYLTDNLMKFYKDKGLSIPDMKVTLRTTVSKQKK